MTNLYRFPQKALFNRVLPKRKIYEYAKPRTKVKQQFVTDVDKIVWTYKLSPETVNLPAAGSVQEIQILTIRSRSEILKHEVLQTIDKAIPSPIIFTISYGERIRYTAAYKRPSEADKGKWVVGGYFETDWMPDDTETVALPVVLSLESLYHTMLMSIVGLPARVDEPIDDYVARAEKLQTRQYEAAKKETKLYREKQFNRKVGINADLRKLRQEIDTLKH